jgi:hypothetical protein
MVYANLQSGVFKSAQFINNGDCKTTSNSEYDLNYIV